MTTPMKQVSKSFKKLLQLDRLVVGVVLMILSHPGMTQEYTAFNVLGTSQAMCKPGISSAEELQAYFVNNRELVEQVLQDADWEGNPEDLFNAIAAGEFTSGSYAKGSRFDWTGLKKDGRGQVLRNRIWGGEQPIEGFEVNVTSQCKVHKLVIPNACCNLSLMATTEITTPAPAITIDANNQDVKICADAGTEAVITRADGSNETVPLDANGCWSGTQEPGTILVEVTNTDECGSATSSASHLVAAAPVAAAVEEPAPPAPSWIPFVGLFAGVESRMRLEPEWDLLYEDDADVIGVKAGVLKPLSETLSAFGQIGYLDRDGVNSNYVYSDDTWFADVGLDRALGSSGFIGGGLGYWNIGDTDFDDVSLFVHGGSGIGGSNAQWYVEGRVFGDELSNIDSDNMVTGGIRYLFK
ncbi:MAG: hypothetical protein ACR2QW_06685 [bacterium]